MFLTYTEYVEWGGKLQEVSFNRAEFNAQMMINKLTNNLIKDESPVREVVKRLVLELVDRGYLGSLDGKDTTSESAGRVSASFESNEGKAEKLIRAYLAGETTEDGELLIKNGGMQSVGVVRV